MGDREAKDAVFDRLAQVAKALGNGRRAELVDVLAQGERSVEELSHQIGQSVANTSQHLRVLARSGLVATRREGTHIYYRLASPVVEDLWAALRVVAEHHVAGFQAVVDAYLGDRDGLAEMTRDELAARLGADDIAVFDVRPAAEFEAGHIPSAVSVPVDEVERRLAELPDGVDVVAYCRGPYCIYAVDAARAGGKRVVRLQDGFPEWKRAGLPVEKALEEP